MSNTTFDIVLLFAISYGLLGLCLLIHALISLCKFIWRNNLACLFFGHDKVGFYRHFCNRCHKDIWEESYESDRAKRPDAEFHDHWQSGEAEGGGE